MKIAMGTSKEELFNLGYVIGITAGIFQIISAIFYYVLSFHPELTRNLPPYWTLGGGQMVLYLAPTTALTRGFAYIFLLHFGLKTKQKWCWYFLIMIGLITPLQNLIMQIKFSVMPTGFFQLVLIFPALLLMAPYVFSGNDKKLI